MPSIETYRKQAKQLVRWHRERNYSIGEKLRLLERYRHLTDVEVLEMAMPLTLAQEIVAAEAGFRDWAALKSGAGDLTQAAAFYEVKLGFHVDCLHGKPPFYGSVSRNRACLRKLPRQVDTAKRDWPVDEGLGRKVSGGTRPRLSCGRSLL